MAGIGRGQLKVLDQRIAKKKYIFEYYRRELSALPGVAFLPVNPWDEPNYWLSCLTVGNGIRPIDIIEALEAANIESRPTWKPMHLQPFYSGCDFFGSGVSEELFDKGICLPSDTKLTDEDLARVVHAMRKSWK